MKSIKPRCSQSTRPVRSCHSRLLSDRKSTRLNSSHSQISYAVFCLKKKNKNNVVTNWSYLHKLGISPHMSIISTPGPLTSLLWFFSSILQAYIGLVSKQLYHVTSN